MNKSKKLLLTISLFLVGFLLITIGCTQQNPFFGIGADVDQVKPTVSITSPLNGDWEKASFSLLGNCFDNVSISKIEIKLINKDSSSGVESVGRSWDASVSGNTWSKNFTLDSDFGGVEGFKTLDVYAYDAAGNSANTRILIGITNQMSQVFVTSPLKLDSAVKYLHYPTGVVTESPLDSTVYENLHYFINRTATISGYTTSAYPPDNSISLILMDYGTDGVRPNNPNDMTISAPDSTTNTVNWSFSVNTTTLTDGNIYLMRFVPVDKAGNQWQQDAGYVKVLQSTADPKVIITSPINGSTVFPSTKATGQAFQYKALGKIYYYVGQGTPTIDINDYTTWPGVTTSQNEIGGVFDLGDSTKYTNLNPDYFIWSFTTPSGSGSYTMYVVATDKDGLPIKDNTSTYVTKSLFVQQTADTPVISITSPDSTVTQSSDISVSVSANGGTGKYVNEIVYTISSTLHSETTTRTSAGGNFAANQNTVNDTLPSFDPSAYIDSTHHTVKITVKCKNSNGDYSQAISITVNVDITPPSVSITSPSSGTVINGVQTISGTDSDWSSVDAIYIGYINPNLAYSTPVKSYLDSNSVTSGTPAFGQWFKIVSPSTGWTYNYDTNVITTGLSVLARSDYNLHVIAVDTIGNLTDIYKTYDIDQDLDKPHSIINDPDYSTGTVNPTSRNSYMKLVSRTYLVMGEAWDDDGVQEVHAKIELVSGGVATTVSGYSDITIVGSASSPLVNGTTHAGWSYKLPNLAISADNEFYKMTTWALDTASGKLSNESYSYFVVSNEQPEVLIISPSASDPDEDTTNLDNYGTVISNVKEDMYWDNIINNNHIYFNDDSARYLLGWNTMDLSEVTLNINPELKGSAEAADSLRANYYRMIFKAKDNSKITKVELSLNGGVSYDTLFVIDSSNIMQKQSITNPAIKGMDIAKTVATPVDYSSYEIGSDKYLWFYVDINMAYTSFTNSAKFTVKITDDNVGTSYEGYTSVNVNIDTTPPSGDITMWGANTTGSALQLSKTNKYIGGTYSDTGAAGVRYVNLYVWDNQATDPDATANYNGNTVDGTKTSGTQAYWGVIIPDNIGLSYPSSTSDYGNIISGNTTNKYPNYWVRALKNSTTGWKIEDIYGNQGTSGWDGTLTDVDGISGYYQGIENKYSAASVSIKDGKKLVCLEIIDNAGNTTRKFYEEVFSQYPPSIASTTSILWTPTYSGGGTPSQQTQVITSGTIYVSTNLDVNIYASDSGTNAGINRVRVALKNSSGTIVKGWTTATADSTYTGTVVKTGSYYNFSNNKDISALSSGNYTLEIEVRDKDGGIASNIQTLYIDNVVPTITVSHPIANQSVVGTFTIDGSSTTDTHSGILNSLVNIGIYNGTTLSTGFNSATAIVSSDIWSYDWSVSATTGTFDNIKVYCEDLAKNRNTVTVSISKDSVPPYYSTFSIPSSKSIVLSSFLNNYTTTNYGFLPSDITSLLITKTTSNVITTVIKDDSAQSTDNNITSAQWRIIGHNQGIFSSSSPVVAGVIGSYNYSDFTPNTDSTAPYQVGDGTTYTVNTASDGEYLMQAKIIQNESKTVVLDSDSSGVRKSYYIVDSTKPHIWMIDMQNSDYVLSGSTKYGHIDTGLNSNGSSTGYDDVSGVVTVYIKAFDNYFLNNIQMRLTDYNFGSGDSAWVDMITRNATTGAWETAASRGTLGDLNYFKVTVQSQELTSNRDYIYLKLEFNTANLTGVTGLNKLLEFRAYDMAGNESVDGTNASSEVIPGSEPNPSATTTVPDYQKWVRKGIDIVPYISKITTFMSGAWLSNPSAFDRSALGHYPVWVRTVAGAGSVGYETITVSGYNINTSSTATINGIAATTGSLASPFTSCTVALNATVTSGEFVITSGGLTTTNNVNTNANDTNKEANNLNNNILTDDRTLDVWDFMTLSSTTQAKYPVMTMTGNNLNFSYGLGADTYLIRTGVTANNGTSTTFETCYSQYGPSAFGFDTNSNVYSVTLDTDRVSSDFSGATRFYFFSKSPGGSTWNYTTGTNKRLLESNWDGSSSTYNNYRSINTSMVVKGAGTDASRAKIYLTYYDDIQKKLKFRYLTVGTSADSINKTNGVAQANLASSDSDGSEDSFNLIADSTNGSPYSAVGVTSAGYIVVVWYDAVSGYLRYKYTTTNLDSNASPTWATNIDNANVSGTADGVIDETSAGEYVSVTVDSHDGIHIAYFDSTYQNLKYAYLSAYNSTSATVVTVDNFFSAGTNLSIKTKWNGTYDVPYITYYQQAKSGSRYPVRIAYRNDFTSLQNGSNSSDFYSGAWECSSIPAQYNVPEGAVTYYKISLDFNSSGVPYVSYYTNGGIEYAKLK